MTIAYFILALLMVFPVWLASPLPSTPLFMIALFSLTALSLRQSLVIVLVAGVLADLFSPMKGLSTVIYFFGFIAARLLAQHVFDTRTLLGCMILFVGTSAIVGYVPIIIGFGLDAFFMDDRAAAGAYALTAGLMHIPWLLVSIPVSGLLYCLSTGHRSSV